MVIHSMWHCPTFLYMYFQGHKYIPNRTLCLLFAVCHHAATLTFDSVWKHCHRISLYMTMTLAFWPQKSNLTQNSECCTFGVLKFGENIQRHCWEIAYRRLRHWQTGVKTDGRMDGWIHRHGKIGHCGIETSYSINIINANTEPEAV